MCDVCGWEFMANDIHEYLQENDSEFLENLLEWITENEHISENQTEKIEEIIG